MIKEGGDGQFDLTYTVGIGFEKCTVLPSNEGIGIDLGIKDLAICSDEHKYQNINKTQKVKKIEKKKT